MSKRKPLPKPSKPTNVLQSVFLHRVLRGAKAALTAPINDIDAIKSALASSDAQPNI